MPKYFMSESLYSRLPFLPIFTLYLSLLCVFLHYIIIYYSLQCTVHISLPIGCLSLGTVPVTSQAKKIFKRVPVTYKTAGDEKAGAEYQQYDGVQDGLPGNRHRLPRKLRRNKVLVVVWKQQ
jgi:hypothetical protein